MARELGVCVLRELSAGLRREDWPYATGEADHRHLAVLRLLFRGQFMVPRTRLRSLSVMPAKSAHIITRRSIKAMEVWLPVTANDPD
jgi:hypothetical protein